MIETIGFLWFIVLLSAVSQYYNRKVEASVGMLIVVWSFTCIMLMRDPTYELAVQKGQFGNRLEAVESDSRVATTPVSHYSGQYVAAASSAYHLPDCPLINRQTTIPSQAAAALAKRKPCPLCLGGAE